MSLKNDRRRIVYILAPLLFLVLVLATPVVWRVLLGRSSASLNQGNLQLLTSPDASRGEPSPVVESAMTQDHQAQIALATPWAISATADTSAASVSPGVSVTPAPTLAPLEILGPPDGSHFRGNDEATFLWRWPGNLGEDQRFAIYLTAGDSTARLGSVDEANFGGGFRLVAALPASIEGAGAYGWAIVLEDTTTGDIILQGETRSIAVD